jgi:Na+-driven multidrug efflux pump
MKAKKNMTLWSLSWPVMIEMFLQFAIGTADTLMVSRISDDAVAVVGFANQFFNAVMILFMLVASGAGILIAQRMGARYRLK